MNLKKLVTQKGLLLAIIAFSFVAMVSSAFSMVSIIKKHSMQKLQAQEMSSGSLYLETKVEPAKERMEEKQVIIIPPTMEEKKEVEEIVPSAEQSEPVILQKRRIFIVNKSQATLKPLYSDGGDFKEMREVAGGQYLDKMLASEEGGQITLKIKIVGEGKVFTLGLNGHPQVAFVYEGGSSLLQTDPAKVPEIASELQNKDMKDVNLELRKQMQAGMQAIEDRRLAREKEQSLAKRK